MTTDRSLLMRVLMLPHGRTGSELDNLCVDILEHTGRLVCSFCGKDRADVKQMIQAVESCAMICHGCLVEALQTLLADGVKKMRVA